MKNEKYQTVGTFPKFNRKIVARDKIDTPNTQIHDNSLSCLGTGTSIKSGGVKLILLAQTFPFSEMMWSCKCFPCVSKMQMQHYNNTSHGPLVQES